jgi:hypothetical protein
MLAVGLALVWAGYTIGLYGYILVKGYDVSFKQLFVGPATAWPPHVPVTQ